MFESWLQAPESGFHNLVASTKITYPLFTTKEQALNYLKIIDSWGEYYLSSSNFKLIDYERFIYLECEFTNDEEIMSLVNRIKQRISRGYKYKQQYLKRITNPIPREHFDLFHDEYLAKRLKVDANIGDESLYE